MISPLFAGSVRKTMPMANFVDKQLNNGSRIKIDPKGEPFEKAVESQRRSLLKQSRI